MAAPTLQLGALRNEMEERAKKNDVVRDVFRTHTNPTITMVREVQRTFAKVLAGQACAREQGGHAWLIEDAVAYNHRIGEPVGTRLPTMPKKPK